MSEGSLHFLLLLLPRVLHINLLSTSKAQAAQERPVQAGDAHESAMFCQVAPATIHTPYIG